MLREIASQFGVESFPLAAILRIAATHLEFPRIGFQIEQFRWPSLCALDVFQVAGADTADIRVFEIEAVTPCGTSAAQKFGVAPAGAPGDRKARIILDIRGWSGSNHRKKSSGLPYGRRKFYRDDSRSAGPSATPHKG